MAKILSDFIEGKGIILAALLDKDGFPLASIVAEQYRDEYQIKSITPTISNFHKQLKDLAEKIKMVEATSVTIELKKGILYLNFLNERNEYLAVLADAETKLGLLHMECKKVIKAMSEVI